MINTPRLVIMNSEMVSKMGIPEVLDDSHMQHDWEFKYSKLLIFHGEWAAPLTQINNSALRKERKLGK